MHGINVKKNAVMAIVPARSGSKGVVGKNIRLLGGHPLLAWSIAAAKRSRLIGRVIISTDSQEYAEIAKQYGAEAPFLRPGQFASDTSKDIDFFLHALNWLLQHEGEVPEYLVHLRPTTPLRDPCVMDRAIGMIMDDPTATSLCSASETYPPCKYFSRNADGSFSALLGEDLVALPRQDCPRAYDPNGYVDVLKSRQLLENGTPYGSRRLAFICDFFGDIDTEEHFRAVEDSDEMRKAGALLFDGVKPQPRPTALRHFGLVVNNLEICRKFYQEVFNLHIASQADESGAFLDAVLRGNGIRVTTVKMRGVRDQTLLELLRFSNPEAIDCPPAAREYFRLGFTHAAFTVSDIRSTLDNAEARGGMRLSDPQTSPDGMVRVAFLRDPEGNLIEAVQPL